MKLTNKMMDKFKRSIIKWTGLNSAMKHVYAKDRKDLREVYNLLRQKEFEKAKEKAYWLDTIVRDQIPEDVYNFMDNITDEIVKKESIK
jgi:hypothetical protein